MFQSRSGPTRALPALLLAVTLLASASASAGARAPSLGEGWLGVALGSRLGPRGRFTVVVASVLPGSPAATSGLQRGDALLSLGTTPLRSVGQLVSTVRRTRPGTKVKLIIQRRGKFIKVPLLLGVRPSAYQLIRRRFIGRPAPAVISRDVRQGKLFSLKAHRGKVVLLDFWATWCGPCRLTLPVLDRLARRFKRKKVAIVGISDEPPARLRKAAKRLKLSYPIVHDTKRKATGTYLISALPTMFLIDQRGVVRKIFFGAQNLGAIEPSIRALLARR